MEARATKLYSTLSALSRLSALKLCTVADRHQIHALQIETFPLAIRRFIDGADVSDAPQAPSDRRSTTGRFAKV